MSKVGFVGLGIMGTPMTGHLLAGGHEVFAYDLRPPAASLVAQGAKVCASGKEVAQRSEIVITMVPDTPHVAAALGHLGNAAHPDVQQAIREIFERTRARGKACGILAPVEADARRYLDWGADFVAVGSDLGLFRSATQALRDRFVPAA